MRLHTKPAPLILMLLACTAPVAAGAQENDELGLVQRSPVQRSPCTTPRTKVAPIPSEIGPIIGLPYPLPLLNASVGTNWPGMNSYFLYALTNQTRHSALGNMSQLGVKVIRIFVAGITAGFKNTDAIEVSHFEPAGGNPGDYNYQVLDLINELMAEVVGYGMKLSIVLHDRYALGCYSDDAYVQYLGLTSVAPWCGCWLPTCKNHCCAPTKVNDATQFYYSTQATKAFDRRIKKILEYKNPKLGNKSWGQLSEAIAMVAPQNEASIALNNVKILNWHCDRAKVMRKYLAPEILIATGGGQTFDTSMWMEHFQCPDMDVVTLHDYNAQTWNEINGSITRAAHLATANQKRAVMEEFGSTSVSYRPQVLQAFGWASIHNGIPWMPWEYMIPDSTNGYDYEFNQNEVLVWNMATDLVQGTTNGSWPGRFTWPNIP